MSKFIISQSFDQSPYSGYVHPLMCEKLRLAGVTKQSLFLWQIMNNVAELSTFYFDKDDYYGAASVEIAKLNNPFVLPAYTMKEIEAVMPGGYCLTRDAFDEYELSVDALWNCGTVKGKRLPDVFADMLLQLIRQRIVQPETVNKRLHELLK